MNRLPQMELQRVIARIIISQVGLALPLLLVNKTISAIVCNILYEEAYVPDVDEMNSDMRRRLRSATILARPSHYGKYVRILVIVPQTVAQEAFLDDSVFGFDTLSICEKRLSPRSLALLLAKFPSLTTVVWASDRAPPPQLVPLLCRLNSQVTSIVLRPAQAASTTGITNRWEGCDLAQMKVLQYLSVSHLSVDGVKTLAACLDSLKFLTHLTVDSQFTDDNLLRQAGEMAALTHLTVRCTGTKVTDKGILSLLDNTLRLQSLELNHFEGRLSKKVWSSIESLPDSFSEFRLSFSEERPHHSWVVDHLNSTFTLLSSAPKGLKIFSITKVLPKPRYVRLNGTEQDPTPADGMQKVKCIYPNPCDNLLRSHKLPNGALECIQKHGHGLEILELDMFPLSIEEARVILDSCRNLRYLRILLDAPLAKLLAMSSTFVPLQHLRTLYVGVTDAFCPMPYIIQTLPEDHAPIKGTSDTRQSPVLPMPELSPASIHTSLSASEHEAISPSSSPQMLTRFKDSSRGQPFDQSASLLLFNGPSASCIDDNLGCINALISSTRAPDVSIPPKRDIRKLARRCPTLEKVRWFGRTGKGDWLIDHSAKSKATTIRFVPIYMVASGDEAHDVAGGGDVQQLIVQRRVSNNTDARITSACEISSRQDTSLWKNFDEGIQEKIAAIPAALLDDFEFPQLRVQPQFASGDDIFHSSTSHYRSSSQLAQDVFSPLSGIFSRSSFQAFEQQWPDLAVTPPYEKEDSFERSQVEANGRRASSMTTGSPLSSADAIGDGGGSFNRARRATMSSSKASRTLHGITSSLPSAQVGGG